MFRSLILLSSICILLLFGYLTMEKASQTKIKEAVNDIKTTASDEIKKNIEDTPVIGEAFEKTKDITNSVLEKTNSSFEETGKPAYEDITEDLKVETEVVKDPVIHTKDVNTDKWAVLSDTHEVLSNVGEMLK